MTKIYGHLIFTTKNRELWLDEHIRTRVHAYLATVIRDLDSPWVVVGGVADHVHILFDIGKKTAPVRFVEHAKRESSKFIETLGPKYSKFYKSFDCQSLFDKFSVRGMSDEAVEHVKAYATSYSFQ